MQRPHSPILPALTGNPWMVYFQGLVENADLSDMLPAHPLGRKQIEKQSCESVGLGIIFSNVVNFLLGPVGWMIF